MPIIQAVQEYNEAPVAKKGHSLSVEIVFCCERIRSKGLIG